MANLITNEGSEEACEWLAKWEQEQPNQEAHGVCALSCFLCINGLAWMDSYT
jgi:hypothetical protein